MADCQAFAFSKSAEIQVAPLTLFVGDNNSGKSYLMFLLWGIRVWKFYLPAETGRHQRRKADCCAG